MKLFYFSIISTYVRIIIVFYIETRKGKVINMGMTMTQKILAAHAGLTQ